MDPAIRVAKRYLKRQASARWIQRSDKRYEANVGFLTLKVWKNKSTDVAWSWDVDGATLAHPGHTQKTSIEDAQRAAIEYCQQELDSSQRTLTILASLVGSLHSTDV